MIIEHKAIKLVQRLLEVTPEVRFSSLNMATGGGWEIGEDWYRMSVGARNLTDEFYFKVVAPYVETLFAPEEITTFFRDDDVIFVLANPISEPLDTRWWARTVDAMQELEVEMEYG
jgi:hypothetical protein